MNKKYIALSAPLIIIAISSAFASTKNITNNTSRHGGIYIGGNVGYANSDTDGDLFNAKYGKNEFSKQTKSIKNLSAGAHIGYLFDITNNFLLGPELGYVYLPTNSYSFNVARSGGTSPAYKGKIKYKQQAGDVLLVAKYYINNSFNVFGKVGAEYLSQTITQDTTLKGASKASTLKDTHGKVMPKVVAGVGYNITSNIELTLAYSYVFSGDKASSRANDQSNYNLQAPLQPLVNDGKLTSSSEVMGGVNFYF